MADAPYTLTGVGEPTQLNGQLVSSEFFPVLGVRPLLGRDAVGGRTTARTLRSSPCSATSLWQRRFGGDPGVIGRVIQLNDRPSRSIGVMPAGFRFVYPNNDLWGAMRLDRDQDWRRTAGRFMNVVGRLAPGTTGGGARNGDGGDRAAAGRDPRVQQEHLGHAGAAARGADRPGADLAPGALRRGRRCCCRSPASTSPTCCWHARPRGAARSPSAPRSAPGARPSSSNCSWKVCCSRWRAARSASRWRAGASTRCWRSRRRICCACPSWRSIAACCCTRSASRC